MVGDGMAQLQFREGDRVLFVQRLRDGRTVIGRADGCDVALPSDQLSRVHCLVEQRGDGWWLTDRSRHGTRVNGEQAIERRQLVDGDTLALGPYVAEFRDRAEPTAARHAATAPMPAAVHEELVEVSALGITASRAVLHFLEGAHAGHRQVLKQARTTLGGPGADLVLDDTLPEVAVRIRVVRGRAMVEPAHAVALLAGRRVRELTPVVDGELVRVGVHAFAIETHTAEDPAESEAFGEMVGGSAAMRRVFGVLARVAAHDHPALLTGESGTGKELAARGIHGCGPRHAGPFVAVNCAAIAEGLFESELFGHTKGAFTGAAQRTDGAFQRADGGTLFLDEIGELRIEVQAKLLRALESGEVRRVGGAAPEFPDVRIVAATNRDLAGLARDGGFREDLLFRLGVLTVHLPPLRDRVDDIAPLARAVLARNHPDASLAAGALQALESYEWPGNVRELRNVLTRAVVLHGPRITRGALEFHPWSFDRSPPPLAADSRDPERDAIRAALARNGGNRTRTARELGMPRSSLLYRMKRLGLT